MPQERAKIVIPDDFPPVISGTPALATLQVYGHVDIYTSRPDTQDKLITLATLGKPWWAVGTFGTRRYEKALMRAGDAAFHGLDDTLDQLGTELDITTRIDRMGAFKNLPNRSEDYTLRSLRPVSGLQGALNASSGDFTALTSEGAPGRTEGPAEGTPQATQGGAQANNGSGTNRVSTVKKRKNFDPGRSVL